MLKKFDGPPNGIALSPDEKYLYVNESPTKAIFRFKILPDDTVGDMETFIKMSEDKEKVARDKPMRGAPDGMKVDKKGNVYCTGPGGLWIISPKGKHLGTVRTPKRVSNLAFGGDDGKTVFMTSHTGELYRVTLKVEGVRP